MQKHKTPIIFSWRKYYAKSSTLMRYKAEMEPLPEEKKIISFGLAPPLFYLQKHKKQAPIRVWVIDNDLAYDTRKTQKLIIGLHPKDMSEEAIQFTFSVAQELADELNWAVMHQRIVDENATLTYAVSIGSVTYMRKAIRDSARDWVRTAPKRVVFSAIVRRSFIDCWVERDYPMTEEDYEQPTLLAVCQAMQTQANQQCRFVGYVTVLCCLTAIIFAEPLFIFPLLTCMLVCNTLLTEWYYAAFLTAKAPLKV